MATQIAQKATRPASPSTFIAHRQTDVAGTQVYYREAGDPTLPTLLLLHGFPSSSHMFRDLIPRLADQYQVVAPDMPGFGFTTMAMQAPDFAGYRREPDAPNASYRYTFDNLAATMSGFITALGLKRYALYVFDYGAPVGFRLALKHPEQITAIISQNGNAYVEGLSDGWNPIEAYWKAPTAENRAALRGFMTSETTKWQYTHGVSDPTAIAPESYTLDALLMARPGNDEIQLDLFRDYENNVALYPAFQKYFRDHRPPLLAVWGKNDPFFLPPGAEAFKRDIPDAEIHLLDTGHFALETHAHEIAGLIDDFLSRKLSASSTR